MNTLREITLIAASLFAFQIAGSAQYSAAVGPVGVPARQSSGDEKLIEPTRPTIANSAEFQAPGVLQVEYGFDSNFRANEFRSQFAGPLVLRFAASSRVLLHFDVDTYLSMKDESGTRETGLGDMHFGVQFLAAKEKEQRPAVAFAYFVKAPTASSERMLGTGRTDHRFVLLLSKKFGETDVNFNAAYINVGREFGDRRASGGQAALAVSREFRNNFGMTGEIGGQSEDFDQPRGVYALGAGTYKLNNRLRFDAGVRVGLTPASPRFGVFAGFTTGVTGPYKR